jgi:ribosomal protein S18 acetylase RimI-like enzyme
VHIEDASGEQAPELAFLINLAGEGIPQYLWTGMAQDGEDPMDIGAQRAAREEGGFSYRNARVCMEDGQLLGMMIAYQQPSPYDTSDIDDYPEVVRPLVLLEAEAPGSWYINAVATFEQFRGRGVARELLAEAEAAARAAGCEQMSLIVASENTGARRLYEHLGYRTVATRPVVSYPGCLHGGDWELMTLDLQGA